MGFLRRMGNLGVDPAGALTGVTNIVPIRWFDPDAYASHDLATDKPVPEGKIPAFLRRIEWKLPETGGDAEILRAVRRYNQSGLSRMAHGTNYKLVIDQIARRIQRLRPLPAGNLVNYAAMENAFAVDWPRRLKADPMALPEAAPAPVRDPTKGWSFGVVHLVAPNGGGGADALALREELDAAGRAAGATLQQVAVDPGDLISVKAKVDEFRARHNGVILAAEDGSLPTSPSGIAVANALQQGWEASILVPDVPHRPAAAAPAIMLPANADARMRRLQLSLVRMQSNAMKRSAPAPAPGAGLPTLSAVRLG